MLVLAIASATAFGFNLNAAVPVTVSNGTTADPSALVVEFSGHTAGGDMVAQHNVKRNAHTATSGAGAYIIKLVPFSGTPKSNIAFADLMNNAIMAERTSGTLPKGNPVSMVDPRLIDHITPFSLMSTPVDITYYRGDFAPTGAFATANGENTWILCHVKSAAGVDDVSLAMASAHLSSFDQGNNSLGETVTFSSNSYTPLALGWHANGNPVTSGDASVLVKEFVVVIGFKHYTIKNVNDEKKVLDYVVGDYSISFGLTVGDSFKAIDLGLNPPPVTARPGILAKLEKGTPVFLFENNGNTNRYAVQIATTLGDFHDYPSLIKGGDFIAFSKPDTNTQMFIRYKP